MQYASMNAARRGALCARNGNGSSCLNHPHAQTNVILDITREYSSGDPWHDSSELLYALHRLWNAYQSPDMGTSPIDAYDAGDECPLYDDIIEYFSVNDVTPHGAARMIRHATRVAMRWNDQVWLAGKGY